MRTQTKCIWLMVFGAVFMIYLTASAQQDNGPEEMVLEGGRTGDVSFPHRLHQKAVDQKCEVCHDLFDRKTGSIQELIGQGKLKSKEIMNRHCVKCHREMKREGKKTGPISCAHCHNKG